MRLFIGSILFVIIFMFFVFEYFVGELLIYYPYFMIFLCVSFKAFYAKVEYFMSLL